MARANLTVHSVRELSDGTLLEAQRTLASDRRRVDAQSAVVAAEIAFRSRQELGHEGLAQRLGARTPERLVQRVTGTSARDAQVMVRVGGLPIGSPLREAVASGGLGLDAADAIRAGVGDATPSAVVEGLILEAADLSVEKLGARAREVRAELDEDGVADRERHLRDRRFLRLSPAGDGMTRLIGLLDPESAAVVVAAYDGATSPRRGGPRFVDPEVSSRAEDLMRDERTTEQLALDSFVELVRIGTEADSGVLPFHRPAVRVLITDRDLARRAGSGLFEGQPHPISIATVERHVCETGVVPVLFDTDGQAVNVGREQRRFTPRQRVGLATRDGGCLFPRCDRPPSWCEAHHITPWVEGGRTDIADGGLLCKHHHLMLHNNGWRVERAGAGRRGAPDLLSPPPPPPPDPRAHSRTEQEPSRETTARRVSGTGRAAKLLRAPLPGHGRAQHTGPWQQTACR